MSRFSETYKAEWLRGDTLNDIRVFTAREDAGEAASGRLVVSLRSRGGAGSADILIDLTAAEMRRLADILQRAAARMDALQAETEQVPA